MLSELILPLACWGGKVCKALCPQWTTATASWTLQYTIMPISHVCKMGLFDMQSANSAQVLSAVRALYEPLLPHPASRTAPHPIAEHEVPCTDDFDPW